MGGGPVVAALSPPLALNGETLGEGVDEGVDHGVGVPQDDGHVEHPEGRARAAGAEEREAVDDVQRQPADGEDG